MPLCAQNSTMVATAQNISDSTHIKTLFHADSTSTQKTSKAIDSEVIYSSADSIIFDVTQKKVISYGDAHVEYENIDLQSYYISLHISNSEIFAKGMYDSLQQKVGFPKYTDDSDFFDADSMQYNFKTRRGLAYGVITQQDEGYLHGQKTKIHNDKEIHIEKGKYTTCDAENPHFHVHITRGKVIPNDKIIFGPAWLIIDEIPIPLVIPFGFFPNKKGRSNGILLPTVGEEAAKGFYFRDMGIYLGFSEYADLRWTADYYTLGSWRTNIRTNYVKRYTFNGSFDVSYASLVYDEIRQAPQFNVRWNHSQDPKSMNGGQFSANVNYGSIGYAQQNSNDHEEFLNNRISSSITYSKRFTGTPFGISSSFMHEQNNIDSTISLTLPQLNWTMSSITPFATKKTGAKQRFFNKITVSYTGAMQNKLTGAKLDSTFYTQQTLNDFQKAINHQVPISTNITLFKFFTLSPSFNYQERWYFEKVERTWDNTKEIITTTDTTYGGVVENTISEFNRVYNYSTSVSLHTKIYGMYQFKSRYIRAIRHVMSPSVSYNLSPDFSAQKYNFYGTYQSNAQGDMREYSYFSNGLYGQPSNTKRSAVSFTLGNNIEAKIRDAQDTVTGYKNVKLIERFTITGSYNFAADSLRMSTINMSGNTKLFKRLDIQYSANYNPYALINKGDKNTPQLVTSNSYMIDKYGRLWRKLDEKWQTSLGYTFGPIKDKKSLPKTSDFTYWDVPWNLRISYSLSVPRKYYYNEFNALDSVSNNVIQTMGINGSFSLTKNWNITFRTGWDFTKQAISYTSIDVYRNLHCWQMTFNWVPIGTRQRWDFTIRVKADMLKDLKLDLRSGNQYLM